MGTQLLLIRLFIVSSRMHFYFFLHIYRSDQFRRTVNINQLESCWEYVRPLSKSRTNAIHFSIGVDKFGANRKTSYFFFLAVRCRVMRTEYPNSAISKPFFYILSSHYRSSSLMRISADLRASRRQESHASLTRRGNSCREKIQ